MQGIAETSEYIHCYVRENISKKKKTNSNSPTVWKSQVVEDINIAVVA